MNTSLEAAKTIAEFVAAAAAVAAGLSAAWTYHRSVKLERARWMKELYEKFYEDARLKSVRGELDSGDQDAISRLVRDEPPDFTDYLKFSSSFSAISKSQVR